MQKDGNTKIEKEIVFEITYKIVSNYVNKQSLRLHVKCMQLIENFEKIKANREIQGYYKIHYS